MGANKETVRRRDIVYILGSDSPNSTVTLTANTKIPSCNPARQILQYLVIENLTGNAVTLNVGTTAAGTDIVNGTNISANLFTVVAPNVIARTAQSLYFTSSNWNSAKLKVTVINKMI